MVPEAIVDKTTKEDFCLTCDIEVSVAGSFAQLVGDDTLVDTSVLRPHSWEDQAMYIPVCRGGTVTRGWSEEYLARERSSLTTHKLPTAGRGQGGQDRAAIKRLVFPVAKAGPCSS